MVHIYNILYDLRFFNHFGRYCSFGATFYWRWKSNGICLKHLKRLYLDYEWYIWKCTRCEEERFDESHPPVSDRPPLTELIDTIEDALGVLYGNGDIRFTGGDAALAACSPPDDDPSVTEGHVQPATSLSHGGNEK